MSTKDLLKARLIEAKAELAELETQAGPLRARRSALQEERAPGDDELRDIHEKLKALEQPFRADLMSEIATLSALPGMADPPAETQVIEAKDVGEMPAALKEGSN